MSEKPDIWARYTAAQLLGEDTNYCVGDVLLLQRADGEYIQAVVDKIVDGVTQGRSYSFTLKPRMWEWANKNDWWDGAWRPHPAPDKFPIRSKARLLNELAKEKSDESQS